MARLVCWSKSQDCLEKKESPLLEFVRGPVEPLLPLLEKTPSGPAGIPWAVAAGVTLLGIGIYAAVRPHFQNNKLHQEKPPDWKRKKEEEIRHAANHYRQLKLPGVLSGLFLELQELEPSEISMSEFTLFAPGTETPQPQQRVDSVTTKQKPPGFSNQSTIATQLSSMPVSQEPAKAEQPTKELAIIVYQQFVRAFRQDTQLEFKGPLTEQFLDAFLAYHLTPDLPGSRFEDLRHKMGMGREDFSLFVARGRQRGLLLEGFQPLDDAEIGRWVAGEAKTFFEDYPATKRWEDGRIPFGYPFQSFVRETLFARL
ncbi:MAG: hypothetical protein Q7S68_06035, partial [Deltaproteobacteria bacterium]|nr:hypothetical protein [Deltaproteobacteria bacterium]